MTSAASRTEAPPPGGRGSLGEVALVFLRLGLTAFGGPAAHVALMEDEFVRRRGGVSLRPRRRRAGRAGRGRRRHRPGPRPGPPPPAPGGAAVRRGAGRGGRRRGAVRAVAAVPVLPQGRRGAVRQRLRPAGVP